MPSNRLTYSEDYNIVNSICTERNVQIKTKETYLQTIDHYTKLFNKSFTSLTQLYYKEEENIVWKKRTLKQHLINYRNYLYNNFLPNTAKIYFGKMLTILRHIELELGQLPKLNNKNTNELPPITYEELPTKSEIENAYRIANPVMKTVILFISSSGCARKECMNLTVKDYLEANDIRLEDKPVKSLLLKVNGEYIPCFRIRRQKTNKFYFTYCSPQANQQIKNYLINREKLSLDSPVFDLNYYYWNKYFDEINTQLKMGKARKFNRFRSHMLRKYHASTLYNNGMGITDIDDLQGRSKDSTHQSYFMEDPELLKKKYIQYMDCLLLEV